MRSTGFYSASQGLSCAEGVRYVVSFGDGLGWVHGWGTLRDVGAMFDVTPFDEVLLGALIGLTSHNWTLRSLRRGLPISLNRRAGRPSRNSFSAPRPL